MYLVSLLKDCLSSTPEKRNQAQMQSLFLLQDNQSCVLKAMFRCWALPGGDATEYLKHGFDLNIVFFFVGIDLNIVDTPRFAVV